MRCGVPAFRRKWPNGEDDGKKDLSLARVRYEQHAKHLRPVPVTHMHERELLTYPLWVWQRVVSHVIFSLTMRDRRHVFQLARSVEEGGDLANLFFPEYGFTLAEFAVYSTLTRRR